MVIDVLKRNQQFRTEIFPGRISVIGTVALLRTYPSRYNGRCFYSISEIGSKGGGCTLIASIYRWAMVKL